MLRRTVSQDPASSTAPATSDAQLPACVARQDLSTAQTLRHGQKQSMAGLTIVTLAVGDRSGASRSRAVLMWTSSAICAASSCRPRRRRRSHGARDTNVPVPLSGARPDSLQAPARALCVGGQLLLNEPPALERRTTRTPRRPQERRTSRSRRPPRRGRAARPARRHDRQVRVHARGSGIVRDEAAVATTLAERRDTVILAAYTLCQPRKIRLLGGVDPKVARDYLTNAPTPRNPSTGRATTTWPGGCSMRSTSSLLPINCQCRSAATCNR